MELRRYELSEGACQRSDVRAVLQDIWASMDGVQEMATTVPGENLSSANDRALMAAVEHNPGEYIDGDLPREKLPVMASSRGSGGKSATEAPRLHTDGTRREDESLKETLPVKVLDEKKNEVQDARKESVRVNKEKTNRPDSPKETTRSGASRTDQQRAADEGLIRRKRPTKVRGDHGKLERDRETRQQVKELVTCRLFSDGGDNDTAGFDAAAYYSALRQNFVRKKSEGDVKKVVTTGEAVGLPDGARVRDAGKQTVTAATSEQSNEDGKGSEGPAPGGGQVEDQDQRVLVRETLLKFGKPLTQLKARAIWGYFLLIMGGGRGGGFGGGIIF